MHYGEERDRLQHIIDNVELSLDQQAEAHRLRALYAIANQFEAQLKQAIETKTMTSESFRMLIRSQL